MLSPYTHTKIVVLLASLLVMTPANSMPACPCEVVDQQRATCGSEPFDTVPQCVPDTITDLQIVISSLQPDTLHRFPQLQTLSLRASGLKTIPEDVFENNGQLIFLDLGINALVSIEPMAFSTLADLQYLYLDNNALATLPDGLLSGNAQLRVLSLASNQLTVLSPSTLETVPLLTQLQLYGNGATLPCDCQLRELVDYLLQNQVSLTRGWTTCNRDGLEVDVYRAAAEQQC